MTIERPATVDVVLPVLDEAEALPWVIGNMPSGFRPIVVDNGSTDGSSEVASDHGAEVVVEPQRGFGAACFTGLLACKTDIVCFMDCDGSLDPRDLPSVVAPVEGGRADLVLGRRIATKNAWPTHARVANRLLALDVGRRYSLRLHDLGPMRAARREALLVLGLKDRRFGWPLEMVLAAAARGWRIEEVPVMYLRRAGRSKVSGTIRGSARAVIDMARVMSWSI